MVAHTAEDITYHLVENVKIYHKCCVYFLKWESNQKSEKVTKRKKGRKHFSGFERERERERERDSITNK